MPERLWPTPTVIAPSFGSSSIADGSDLHVAYIDTGTAYYKKSTDEGATWSSATTIGAAKSTELTRPLTVGADGHIHFFYVREVSSADRLMYRKSTDSGANWSSEIEIHNGGATGFIYRIDSFILSGVLHVAWVWGQDGIMRYRRSDNNGSSFGTAQTPYGTTGLFYRQRIRPVSGGKVHLIFTNNPVGGTFLEDDEIRYGYSNDGGDTWQASVVLGGGANTYALYPDLAVEGDSLIAAWVEAAAGTSIDARDVRFRRSVDAGLNWSGVFSLTDYEEAADHTYLAVSGNRLMVCWASIRSGFNRSMTATSDDFGQNWTEPQETDSTLLMGDTRAAITPNYAHIFMVPDVSFDFRYQRAPWPVSAEVEADHSYYPKPNLRTVAA